MAASATNMFEFHDSVRFHRFIDRLLLTYRFIDLTTIINWLGTRS